MRPDCSIASAFVKAENFEMSFPASIFMESNEPSLQQHIRLTGRVGTTSASDRRRAAALYNSGGASRGKNNQFASRRSIRISLLVMVSITRF